MKVFLSWSGDRSFKFAEILREWLPNVIQACKPWLSTRDIDKGTRWHTELSKELQESKAGIIFLTSDNIESPWILFETGAISKTIERTFVCPWLLDIKPTDIKGPLAQFQATTVDKAETLLLIKTINKALGSDALPDRQLEAVYSKWWSDLEAALQGIPPTDDKSKEKRSDRELLEEILEGVRSLGRQTGVSSEGVWATSNWESKYKNALLEYCFNKHSDSKHLNLFADLAREKITEGAQQEVAKPRRKRLTAEKNECPTIRPSQPATT